jgi:hypothetical protein
MSTEHRCNRNRSQKGPYLVNLLRPATGGLSRGALLVSASFIVLAALGLPGEASCNGTNQIISSPSTPGPILATGGDITIDVGAGVAGGPTGVAAQNCGIGALSNSGAIGGAAGGHGGAGGVGVLAASGQTVDLLTNAKGATIRGGNGGSGVTPGAGGAAVLNAGTITSLTNSGKIAGGWSGGPGAPAGAGVSNAGKIATLINSGAITGGGNSSKRVASAAAGAGVSNTSTITSLTNNKSGTISGGKASARFSSATGGAAVANAGAIMTLTNSGTISGGVANGGAGANRIGGATGGDGLSNAGTMMTVINGGAVEGGAASDYVHTTGGAGVSNRTGAKISNLTNKVGGAIAGGSGGVSATAGAGGAGVANLGAIGTLANRGAISGGASSVVYGHALGGDGVSNSGTVTTLDNRGAIAGGNAIGDGSNVNATGGAGVSNSGTIAKLTNSGMISGGGGAGNFRPGDAILSAGANASIGSIMNSGQIIGNVEIDNQASVAITGGTGTTFGSWTGGTITIGNGNLTFAGGNIALGDNIPVNGRNGTVTNMASLQLAAPENIGGNFTQTAGGVLGLDFGSDIRLQYGELRVYRLATLGGGLAVDLTNGFTLATGDSFDIMTGRVDGDFSSFSLDGVACSAQATDVWSCSNLAGLTIDEVFTRNLLTLDVVSAAAGTGLSRMDFLSHGEASSAAPEPSTWAMLAMGLLGLGGFCLCRRTTIIIAMSEI